MIKRLVELIDKRDDLIKAHFGDSDVREMLNFFGEREWYNKHIVPIEKTIMSVAKKILPNETFNHISDVYSNQFLIAKYQDYKKDTAFQK